MNVVERPEFRRILTLCSRAPTLHTKDVPHRSKLTKTAYELYLAEKDRINHEMQVCPPYSHHHASIIYLLFSML